MCGRLVLSTLPEPMARYFGCCPIEPDLYEPRYNVPPTAEIPIVRAVDGGRSMGLAKWWLIPSWAETTNATNSTFNARAETVATSRTFRVPFRNRRCLVPADGFFEWRKLGEGRNPPKQPHFIHMRDDLPFAFAGLWDRWHGHGETVESCTIITTTPNELMESIHDRMPVILPRAAWDSWLDPENKDTEALEALLVPCPAAEMEAWPVSSAVNNAKNGGGPELIARAV